MQNDPAERRAHDRQSGSFSAEPGGYPLRGTMLPFMCVPADLSDGIIAQSKSSVI
ncbi:hypothetical protein BJX99DRAFT_231878, partial [Aspergillus californicus]